MAATKVVPLDGAGRGAALRLATPQPLVAPGTATADRLRAREEARQLVAERLGPHGVSQKGLARAERWRARREAGPQAVGAAAGDTLKILLVRIAFEEDRTGSLTSITPDGNFLLEPDSTVVFDPPPHDRNYFQSHLDGLAEYWGSMSGGQLVIESTVLPEGVQDAYFLSDIADYGPCPNGPCEDFWTIDKLVDLVRDMVVAADEGTQADGSANLADYDFDDPNTYVIFAHAGGDLQSNLVFTPGVEGFSPNDIPTFFVQLGDEDTVQLTSLDSDSGEPGVMTELSVIPESTSQDGLLGSIAAALYHEFGHALGLPDLYSTVTGLPTVGYWDIMGTGTNLAAAVILEEGQEEPDLVVGLLPPSTGIWAKWFLGWVDPVRVDGRLRKRSIAVASDQADRDKALLLDVSPQEFFLVENRHVPVAAEPGWALIRDPDTGVVQFLGDDSGGGEPVNTHEYDFFNPWPGGLLTWRIRQDRIDANIAQNTVQALPLTRGLELIEADGIQDIGVFEFTTIGFVGSETDAFRDRSEFQTSQGLVVWPRTSLEFGPDTDPSSESSFRIATGARFVDVPPSTNGTVILEAGLEGLLPTGGTGSDPDWPQWLPSRPGRIPVRGDAASIASFRLRSPQGADRGEQLFFTGAAADGSEAAGLYVYGLDAATTLGNARVLELGADAAGPMLRVPAFAGGDEALVLALRDGSVHAFSPQLAPGNLLNEFGGFPLALGDSLDVGPIALDTGTERVLVLGSQAADAIFRVRPNGTVGAAGDFGTGVQNRLRSNLAACEVDDDAAQELAYASGSGLWLRQDSGAPIAGPIGYPEGFRFFEPETERVWVLAWPRATADGPGPDRFALVTEFGVPMVAERDAAGQWSTRFLGRLFSSPLVGEPALGDVDGDGRLDLVVATEKRVWARNEAGVDLFGFPVTLSEQYLVAEPTPPLPASSPVVVDADADGFAEVLLLSSHGLVYGIEPDGSNLAGYPRLHSSATATAPLVVERAGRRGLVLFGANGDSLSRGTRIRSARLTVADLGPAPSVVPAEWWGRGSGSTRGYRGNIGAPVASNPLLAQLRQEGPRLQPNPVTGRIARARFFSGADHEARLTLYTLTGAELLVATQANLADQQGDVAFDTGRLAPGPYVCRLEYVGPAGPATENLTLYIER